MSDPTKEELVEASHVLMRLRGYCFDIQEAYQKKIESKRQFGPLPLPSATELSKCLSWGATALRREAESRE